MTIREQTEELEKKTLSPLAKLSCDAVREFPLGTLCDPVPLSSGTATGSALQWRSAG